MDGIWMEVVNGRVSEWMQLMKEQMNCWNDWKNVLMDGEVSGWRNYWMGKLLNGWNWWTDKFLTQSNSPDNPLINSSPNKCSTPNNLTIFKIQHLTRQMFNTWQLTRQFRNTQQITRQTHVDEQFTRQIFNPPNRSPDKFSAPKSSPDKS